MDFSLLSTIGNISLKLGEASGALVKVELLMRVIAKHSQAVQNQLEVEINQASRKQKKNKNLWDCNLEYLEKAIRVIFSDKLDSSNIEKLKKIRCIRNKFLHIDFVDLMLKCFDILPTGR